MNDKKYKLHLENIKTKKDIMECLLVLDILLQNTHIDRYERLTGKDQICIDTNIIIPDKKNCFESVILSGWINSSNCGFRGVPPYEQIIYVKNFCDKHKIKVVKTEEDRKKAFAALEKLVEVVHDDLKKGKI